MKLIDALKKKFVRPEDALAALGLDAASIAMDEVKHDPKTGQFTAGAGAKPSSKEEHHSQAQWHISEAGKPNATNLAKRQHMNNAKHHFRMSGKGELITGLSGLPEGYIVRPNRNSTKDSTPRVAGDSKENDDMTKVKMSPTALVAIGAMSQYLGTRLAQDSMVDLKPVFAGVTARNFAAQKPYITAKIRAAVSGNLATDADVEDLPEMLDQIEAIAGEASEVVGGEVGPDPMEDLDETKDAGDPGDPAPMGDPDPSAGGGESDANEIEDFLRDKLSPEDLDTVCAMMNASKAGGAIDESDEDRKKREEDMNKAMDSKIRTAVRVAVDAAERRHAEVAEATRIVRPYVGELNVAFDSAEQVYRHTLDALNVPTKGVHRDALPAILAAQPKPGARPREGRIAQDAAAVRGFAERFPSTSRIGTM